MANIAVKDLIKVYRSGTLEVTALRGVTVDFPSASFTAIQGPSGSGKTTLLNMLAGLDLPTAGSIKVNGLELTRASVKELERHRLEGVGVVFQFFNLLPALTALENVEFPMLLKGTPRQKREERARYLLSIVGLSQRADHKPRQMSGGEQQRVAVAAALANDPPLVLADEPTGELDTASGAEVLSLLRKMNKDFGKTVIVVTHDPRISNFADRTLRMEDGRIV